MDTDSKGKAKLAQKDEKAKVTNEKARAAHDITKSKIDRRLESSFIQFQVSDIAWNAGLVLEYAAEELLEKKGVRV